VAGAEIVPRRAGRVLRRRVSGQAASGRAQGASAAAGLPRRPQRRNRLRSSPTSGCHCTATANGQPGASSSTASTTPSSDHRGGGQAVAQPVERLMVMARHRIDDSPAEDLCQPAARGDLDRMRAVRPRHRRVHVVADQVRHVLMQAAAHGHVDHLHAAADAEDGQSALQRGGQQGELGGVAIGPYRAGLRMALRAVTRRVEVAAPDRTSPSSRSSTPRCPAPAAAARVCRPPR